MSIQYTKSQLVETMRAQLKSSYPKCLKALEVISSYQEADELSSKETLYHNKVGFTTFDAEILTSFAYQCRQGRVLSEKQRVIVMRLMPKYARQLVEHSIRSGKIVKNGRHYEVVGA